jgi:hypothetical protein
MIGWTCGKGGETTNTKNWKTSAFKTEEEMRV